MRLPRNKFIRAKKLLKNNQGFTLIEVLIALTLIAMIFGLVLSDPFSNDADLDQQSKEIERAVRFMSDEAALRNSVIRLHFMLNRAPQEYAIEYGPSDSFVLPPEPEFETEVVGKEEEEKANKEIKNINLKFNKIKEFQESNTQIPDSVKIVGIGTSHSSKLKTTGEVSIYSYPTSEKDEAIIILATDEAMVSIEVSPFNQKIEKKTYKIEPVGNREVLDLQAAKAKEIFDTWANKK